MSNQRADAPPKDRSADFLQRDFDQACSEKRRYEDSAWDVCKFAFTVHSGTIFAALAAYQFTLEKKVDLTAGAIALLAMGLATGLFLLLLLVRNRVYFVVAARYINEQRGFFLSDNPSGFKNRSGYYNDPDRPPYFSWLSTQTWAMYLVGTLNAGSAATLIFLATSPAQPRGMIATSTFSLLAICEMTVMQVYLTSREGKTGESAVFGTNAGRFKRASRT